MKKWMSIVLGMVLSLSLVTAINCGGDDDEDPTGCLNCACNSDGTCDAGLECNESNVCVEEGGGDCCDGVEGMIEVSGTVTDLEQNPVETEITALSGTGVILGTATALGTTTSGADGSFTIDCFDVSSAEAGLVLMTGETDGTYFPTYTGVASYDTDADKVCIDATPPVWAMPAAFVAQLDQHPSIDSADGMVLGFIVDVAGAPIADATVTLADGSDVEGGVLYPDPTFQNWDGTATSATGIYIIPGSSSSLSFITTLTAQATGHTFRTDLYKAAAINDAIYMVSMQAE